MALSSLKTNTTTSIVVTHPLLFVCDVQRATCNAFQVSDDEDGPTLSRRVSDALPEYGPRRAQSGATGMRGLRSKVRLRRFGLFVSNETFPFVTKADKDQGILAAAL